MMQRLRSGCLLTLAIASIACGGGGSNPTAPTAAAPPAAATPAPAPAPAPPPVTLTGSWLMGTTPPPYMTLTQNGTTVTGTQPTTMIEVFGVGSTIIGTVTGTVSGTSVNLTFQVTLTARGFGDTLVCRGTDTFSGQISGNTLTGTFAYGATPYLCDGGIPFPLVIPPVPVTFARQ